MLNFIKSKTAKSIGVFVFAVALMFTVASVASAANFTTTMKVGSKGGEVAALQTLVGATADGVFGPMTQAKVKAWQASNGLVADGVFGPNSRAKANAMGDSGSTGSLCPNGMTLASNCTTAPNTSVQVTLCPNGMTLASNCMTAPGVVVQNPTTFMVSSTGTQGAIDEVTSGSSNKSEALEGQSNVEIYAADVKLEKNGPLQLQTVDVWFGNSDNSSSTKPWDYFKSVDLMVGGTKVATANANSSSDWSSVTDGHLTATTTKEYRMKFSGLSSVLASGSTTKVSVAVSVVNTIDSVDQSAVWQIDLGDLRIMDETGFVSNYDASGVQDSFDVAAADVADLDISKSSNDLKASTIEVSKTSDTNGVVIHKFEIEESNGVNANIEEMTATFTTTGAENTIIRRAYLYQGSTKVGEEAMTSNGAVTFDNLDININGDDTKEFTVKVDLYDTNDGVRYAEGSTIAVSINAITVATDANDNDEGDMTLTGSSTSATHELRSEGIKVTLSSATKSKVTGAASSSDTYTGTIMFDVTAFGKTVYIPKAAPAASGDNLLVTIDAGTLSVASLTSNSVNGTNGFEVVKGSTKSFTVTGIVETTSTSSILTRLNLTNIKWGIADTSATTVAVNGYTFNLVDFKTPQDSIKVQ